MVTHDDGEKRCFDLFATLLSAFGDDETRARRGQEVQDRNFIMFHTITTAATNTFLLGNKRKIDDQENTSSSSSLVESKRRRVMVSNEPIRAQPIREIKPPVREINQPVKRKSPVRSEPVIREPVVVTPGWVLALMKTYKCEEEAKMIVEKSMTKTDLTRSQGRLLMPFKQMSDMNFLTEAELKILDRHHKGDLKQGVDVVLLSRGGERRWSLNMRIWEMRNSFNYALCSGWNQVVDDNNLRRDNTISLWSFHSLDGPLYFAFDPPTPALALALVPVNPEASSSSMDPFVCEETNRRLYPFPKRRRTPRVCVQIIIHNTLEGLDLNRTQPEEYTEMASLEGVQQTHTSQESVTETTLDLELRL